MRRSLRLIANTSARAAAVMNGQRSGGWIAREVVVGDGRSPGSGVEVRHRRTLGRGAVEHREPSPFSSDVRNLLLQEETESDHDDSNKDHREHGRTRANSVSAWPRSDGSERVRQRLSSASGRISRRGSRRRTCGSLTSQTSPIEMLAAERQALMQAEEGREVVAGPAPLPSGCRSGTSRCNVPAGRQSRTFRRARGRNSRPTALRSRDRNRPDADRDDRHVGAGLGCRIERRTRKVARLGTHRVRRDLVQPGVVAGSAESMA